MRFGKPIFKSVCEHNGRTYLTEKWRLGEIFSFNCQYTVFSLLLSSSANENLDASLSSSFIISPVYKLAKFFPGP